MAKKPPKKKESRLAMALMQKDRALIDKAAALLGLPPSVWGRAIILKEAAKVVEAAGAK
jgi:uncharacterized protein (DUF1778 family)